MKNAISKLRENSRYMTNSDRKIAEYILLHAEKVAYMNIRELSRETFSSTSTIYRMCCSLGFQGYKDFKQSLIYDVARQNLNPEKENPGKAGTEGLEKLVESVTNQNILSLKDTAELVEIGDLQKCVSLLSGSRTVLLFGMGEALCVARDAYLKFLRSHKPCIFSEDPRTQLLTAENSGTTDLGVVICGADETEDILSCMKQLRKNGTPVIAVARLGLDQVAELADCTLYTAARDASHTDGGTACRISQLNVMDILYTAYVCGQGPDTGKKRY